MKNRDALLRKAMKRIVIHIAIYTIGIFAFIVTLMTEAPWLGLTENKYIYKILVLFEKGMGFLVPIILIIGYFVIIYLELKKSYLMLDDVVQGIENINNHAISHIRFDYDELKEVEELLVQTKKDIELNMRAAKEAEQRKNDLIVYLAHDLKTPLTSIIGYLTLLKDEEVTPHAKNHYVEITLDKAERLEELINEFFEITRFNLTQQALEISRVDMVRLLEQLTYEFKPMFQEKHLECFLHTPKSLEMKCDIQKMQRVLDNLLRNAVNYSFENSDIHITLQEKEEGYLIIFENEGNTIPQEKLNRLFEQFFRLDSSRTSQTGGAGLGLSISKSIIEQHQGTIHVKSYDEKIIFEIYIPRLTSL